MKKRVLLILAALSVMMFTGCSGKSSQPAESSSVAESVEETTVIEVEGPSGEAEAEAPAEELTELKEESSVTGTVDELKDFMIVISTDSGAQYAMTFEDKPEGIDKIKLGDKVEIKYTGVLDEVDAFTGTILSVTKLD